MASAAREAFLPRALGEGQSGRLGSQADKCYAEEAWLGPLPLYRCDMRRVGLYRFFQ